MQAEPIETPGEPELTPLPAPEPELEVDPDILKEEITIDLTNPVTVDGITYKEFSFDFSRISPDDEDRIEKTWKALHREHPWGVPPDPSNRDLQELYLIKAGDTPLRVLRALGTVDRAGVYGLAYEWLGKRLGKTKRRRHRSGS